MFARAGLFAAKKTAEKQLKNAELASLGTQLALLTGYEYFHSDKQTKSLPTPQTKNHQYNK